MPTLDTVIRKAAGPSILLALMTAAPAPASADDTGAKKEPTKDAEMTPMALEPAMSLDPTSPQIAALPGGVTPAYGRRSFNEGDWRFDFHGFLGAPLNIGFNNRSTPAPGQSGTVLHTPPVVPDDLETFSHTGVVPTTYAQLNFSESNSIVSGNISIVAKQANVSTTFLEPASQLGINDAFLSILPPLSQRVKTQLLVGAFTSRYGTTGEYDEGRYGTPVIARVRGVGEQLSAKIRFGDVVVMAEQGLQGQSNKASASVTPDIWNDFADPFAGSSFASHFHLGAAYGRYGWLALHYLRAWSQDDRTTATAGPDGSIDIFGADLTLTLARFGHFYSGFSYTDARYARSVSRIISVLNTRGGLGLMENYLGDLSGGNGTLSTVGWQYDLSVGRLVSYPIPFSGDGPDLFVSLFGLVTKVTSDDTRLVDPVDPLSASRFDGVTKYKWGIEATYSLLFWLAASARYDQVTPNSGDDRYSFAVLSPRLIFRTDWLATDQLVLQYSHWFNGSRTTVRVGDPPREDVTVFPDENMVSLFASMWW